MFIWNSLTFPMIQQMLAIWSLVPLPFLNPACTSGSSQVTYCWSIAGRILSMTLLACEMSAIVQKFEHSLALSFFGIQMKTDLFQSHGLCWVFQICCHTKCSTFTAASFRIWNSSAGIPSLLLALTTPKTLEVEEKTVTETMNRNLLFLQILGTPELSVVQTG